MMELPDIYDVCSGIDDIEVPLHLTQEVNISDSVVGTELTIATPKSGTTHSIVTIISHLADQLEDRFGDGHQRNRAKKLVKLVDMIKKYEGITDEY